MISITGTGYVGNIRDMQYTQEGKAVINLSIAPTQYQREGEPTTWLECTAWGRDAEYISENVKKGTRCAFSADNLRLETWVKDDRHGASIKCNLSRFENLTPRESQSEESNEPPPRNSRQSGGSRKQSVDDGIPF